MVLPSSPPPQPQSSWYLYTFGVDVFQDMMTKMEEVKGYDWGQVVLEVLDGLTINDLDKCDIKFFV